MKIFKKLEGNSRWCLALFPLWAIPYTLYTYYLSLYLLENGVSNNQLGTLMIVSNISAILCSIVASPIVDRLGRKKACLIFDLISSALPPLIYFLTQSFVFSLFAMFLSGANRIMSVGYYLLMIEDRSEENSIESMNIFNIILVVTGMFTPIAGLLVEKYGLESSEKMFLLVSTILMTLMPIVRNSLISETPTGLRLIEESKKKKKSSENKIVQTIRYVFKNKRVFSAVFVNAMIYVYYSVGTTVSLFFTPYFSEYLNLGAKRAGIIGGLFSFGTIFSMIFINPSIKRENIYKRSILACLISMIGFAMIMIAKPGQMGLICAGVLIIAVSYGVLKTVGDSLLALETEGDLRTSVYSFSFFFSSILTIAVVQAVTVLYEISEIYFFAVSALVIVLILVDCFIMRNSND